MSYSYHTSQVRKSLNDMTVNVVRERTITETRRIDVRQESQWRVPVNGTAWWVIPTDQRGRWTGKPVMRAADTPQGAVVSALSNEDGFGFDYVPEKVFVIPATNKQGYYFNLTDRGGWT